MIKVKINGKKEFTVEGKNLNGSPVDFDLLEVRENTFHILRHNKSYNATLVNFNKEEKTIVLNVNGNDYEISVRDKNDLLLEKLGIKAGASANIQSVKAPMPGLIINVAAKEKDEVKKGDTLLILEAMKMENVIKSPRDGKIKKVHAQLKQAVEKNQVLVEFE